MHTYCLPLAISDQQSVLKFGRLYLPALQLRSEFELRLNQTFCIFDLEEMVIKMAHCTWNVLEVYFYAINTNAQALLQSAAKKPLQIGEFLTLGLALSAGSGGNPLLGEQAAEGSKEAIAASLKGSYLMFITAGSPSTVCFAPSGDADLDKSIWRNIDQLRDMLVAAISFLFHQGFGVTKVREKTLLKMTFVPYYLACFIGLLETPDARFIDDQWLLDESSFWTLEEKYLFVRKLYDIIVVMEKFWAHSKTETYIKNKLEEMNFDLSSKDSRAVEVFLGRKVDEAERSIGPDCFNFKKIIVFFRNMDEQYNDSCPTEEYVRNGDCTYRQDCRDHHPMDVWDCDHPLSTLCTSVIKALPFLHKFALHLFKSEDEDFKNDDDDDVWTKKWVPIVEDGRHHCPRVVEYLGVTGCWLDFQIIQFVIKIAVSLEKMTVVPSCRAWTDSGGDVTQIEEKQESRKRAHLLEVLLSPHTKLFTTPSYNSTCVFFGCTRM
ncbi:hypothetical protein RHMOL_Rhmol11G0145100 [Rhododendron molle]|uniref:Uncharacterized protein n=1 Tax=Rhododendron molle TaxID=49168 RepID=A0ACC0LSI8_RHOML|nr:hypothetical protein RHMOL_Rhmol11G0145100 [Rhododendron molle]